MIVEMQPRIINGTSYDMPTVNGMDRCQINTRLQCLSMEIQKLKERQSALLQARHQLDIHNKLEEEKVNSYWDTKDNNINLFDQMFAA